MSSWLPKALGGQSREEKQADEAKAWREGYLGTGDENFKHSREAGEDNGHFKLTEVRQRPKQADRGGSRLVRLPKGHYEEAPQVRYTFGEDRLKSWRFILMTVSDRERLEVL